MRHAAMASAIPSATTRGSRRWRRMRARIGVLAVWMALLVWALGASVRVPGVDPVDASGLVAGGGPLEALAGDTAMPADDLERAAAWPRESADASLAMSHEPTPEEEAALYVAGH